MTVIIAYRLNNWSTFGVYWPGVIGRGLLTGCYLPRTKPPTNITAGRGLSCHSGRSRWSGKGERGWDANQSVVGFRKIMRRTWAMSPSMKSDRLRKLLHQLWRNIGAEELLCASLYHELCVYVFMHDCMHAYMYVLTFVCMYVGMYLCNVFVFILLQL